MCLLSHLFTNSHISLCDKSDLLHKVWCSTPFGVLSVKKDTLVLNNTCVLQCINLHGNIFFSRAVWQSCSVVFRTSISLLSHKRSSFSICKNFASWQSSVRSQYSIGRTPKWRRDLTMLRLRDLERDRCREWWRFRLSFMCLVLEEDAVDALSLRLLIKS
jgi:hypothetical protein